MRLTLRTLLAWLDGLLSAEDQQVLADKVAASPVAPTLVRRIQDVVENAALAAPRIDARGLADDTNSVAEYLDNCLPADRLEAFERICIESDVHLAEVASCHGVLAEMSREAEATAPIDATTCKRLLAAVRDHVASRPSEAVTSVADGPPTSAEPTAGHARPRSTPTGPARRAPLEAWISAAVAIVLLVGLVTVFVRSLTTQSQPRRVAVNAPEPGQPARVDAPAPAGVAPPVAPERAPPRPAEPAAPPADADGTQPVPTPVHVPTPVQPPTAAVTVLPPAAPPAAPGAGAATPPAMSAATTTIRPAAPAPGAAPPEPAAPAAPQDAAGRPTVPQGDALAIAARPAVVEPPRRPAPDDPAAAAPAVPAALVSGPGLLLHRPPAADANPVHGSSGWAALPRASSLAAREELIAPPASRPELDVAGVMIRLEPDSRATLTRDADGTPRLELVFGRATVRAAAADARLGLTAAGLSGIVTDGLRAPVGVEVLLDREPGAEAGDARVRAAIITTTAGIRWRQTRADGGAPDAALTGIAATGLLEAGRRLAWDSHEPDAAAVRPGRDLDWIATPARIDRVDAAAAAAMQARLAGGRPLETTLRAVAADPRDREENRALAAATLALVGEYDELAKLLCAETAAAGLRSGRWRALEQATVPLALARGVNAAERLAQAFEAHAPAGRGREVFALARGVTDAELAAGADARLVDGLDAPELVVRRYAWRNLNAIVPQADPIRSRFDPDWSEQLRGDAVGWWRKQVEAGRIRRSGAANP